ncbi:MAG: hypothetical protein QOI92_2111 [Chloroflexota bacterium]|jgi:sugar lactone lactonase YvrE|nr:hypothetical protein [Chloroflexota bacterium]
MTTAEQWTSPLADHGEGPLWDRRSDSLLWLDMLAGDVLRCSDHGAVSRAHVGTTVAAVRPRTCGGFVLALERSFALTDESLTVVESLAPMWTGPDVRLNEGGCDPQGRFYAGSMAYDGRPSAGAVYRLDHDLSVSVVLPSATVANGLAWSPDGTIAYFIDSATHRLDSFEFDPAGGTLGQRGTVVRIPDAVGTPDGLCVDADGGLWVALWGGHAVHHYSPGGDLLDVIDVPVSGVTACTFGGPAMDQLFITTSRLARDNPEPEAGSVFRATPGTHGSQPHQFAR